jgi:hypothetical protein
VGYSPLAVVPHAINFHCLPYANDATLPYSPTVLEQLAVCCVVVRTSTVRILDSACASSHLPSSGTFRTETLDVRAPTFCALTTG